MHAFTTDLDGVVAAVTESLDQYPEVDYFFIRHWNGGPHVRFRARLRDRRALGERVLRPLESALGDTLGRAPSSSWPSPDAYARLARPLSAREGVLADGLNKLRSPNTFEYTDYVTETDKYGSGEVLDRCEAYFCSQSRTIAGELRRRRGEPGGWRFTAALYLVNALLRVRRATGVAEDPAPGRTTGPDVAGWSSSQLRAASQVSVDVASAVSSGHWGDGIGWRLAEDLVGLAREIGQRTPRGCGPNLVHTSVNRLGLLPERERWLWELARSARDLSLSGTGHNSGRDEP